MVNHWIGILVTALNRIGPAVETGRVVVEKNEVSGSGNVGVLVQSNASDGPASLTNVKVESNDVHVQQRGHAASRFQRRGGVGLCNEQEQSRGLGEASGSCSTPRTDNILSKNDVLRSGARGVVVIRGSSGNLLEKNFVADSGLEGILLFVAAPNNNTVSKNTVVGSGSHGIAVRSGSFENTLLKNEVSDSASGCDHQWDESGSDNCWDGNERLRVPGSASCLRRVMSV